MNVSYKVKSHGFNHGIAKIYYEKLLKSGLTPEVVQEMYIAEKIGTSASQQPTTTDANTNESQQNAPTESQKPHLISTVLLNKNFIEKRRQ